MDAFGYLSYLMPVLGEWSDLAWAPISAYLFLRIFGGKVGNIGSMINLVEELLPFTDFIPTFSIAYFVRKYENRNNTQNKPKGNSFL